MWEQDNIKTAGQQLKMAGIEETGLTVVVKLIDFSTLSTVLKESG